ncbi:MAG: sugar transferase [Bacteroides sp.]|nr:sugar transferase [Eubacterium sp.]MCM1418533.1 sugar transferase [Roseburia sp.]MCM1462586.1 sugar transferase [Bacteroides sp.]
MVSETERLETELTAVKAEAPAFTAEREETRFREKAVYNFFKRFFDILLSFVASIVLLIPMAILALVIVIKDHGSPFYRHDRVGKNGEAIRVYKFRSMKRGADQLEKMLTPEQLAEYKKEYKLKDDPRLIGYKKPGDGKTCFGAKLRTLSADELPQIFFNILLKGDMSIVGPRPILKSELEEHYTPEERKLLLSVKPGLTGYWQAYARNHAEYSNGRRQEMELYYIRNRSFALDIKIIFRTVVVVLKKDGAN